MGRPQLICGVVKWLRHADAQPSPNLMDQQLPLRITVIKPLPGVAIQVQRGRSELLPPSRIAHDAVTFEFAVRVRDPHGDAPPRLLGPYVQGPPMGRFVYVNSGKRAGQNESCWDRRAKVSLRSITPKQIATVLAKSGAVLEVCIAGTAQDRGPACATVPLLNGGWRIVRDAAT